MSMLIVSAMSGLVAEGERPYDQFHLPMPAWAYGAVALGVFMLLLLILWMFRNTAHGSLTESQRAQAQAGHGSHTHSSGGSH